ncbi:MAG: CRISPR-associated endonuclease Cas1, partial [Candidatus Parabeggiatoa sp. nov. 3]
MLAVSVCQKSAIYDDAKYNLKHDFSSAQNKINHAFDNATLMGIEGSVSKNYLAQWRTLWDNAWGFKERNRRPPLDPVNALLSLGYTLAGNSVGHLASRYGLDLALGFLHIPSRNRPS